MERAVVSVQEAAKILGISRAFAYVLVNRGEIPSLRLGRRIVVPRAAVERLINGARGVNKIAESRLG